MHQFMVRACHKAIVLLSTSSNTEYDYELILGDDSNEKSVLKDKDGQVWFGSSTEKCTVGNHIINT